MIDKKNVYFTKNGYPIILPDVKLFGSYKIVQTLPGVDHQVEHIYFLSEITKNHLYIFENDNYKNLAYTAQEVLTKIQDGTLRHYKGGMS